MSVSGPDPIDVEVGARVRSRRRQLGLSQTDLSGALGLSSQQIQKYERGRNRISASMLAHIASKLHTTVADLIGEARNPFAIIGRADLATSGAVELLDCYSTIEDSQVRRMILTLATALAGEAARRQRDVSNDDERLAGERPH